MTNADHYDWKVVKIKGYNAAKRSIQATAINSIDIIDIEEKSGVSTSWFELLSNQKLKSYAPPGSVVAVYSLRGSDSQKSYIAGWAKSITKNPEAEKLIVSPFTILPFVAQSRTSQPIVYGKN